MRTMHLFAGAGGGLLADLILGHEPVCAVEWDPYTCAVLRERAADGWFPGLHVHEGDVRLFDPSAWASRVDCIHAGFPCQDISVAGNGAGINGERSGLYREVLRIADVVRPRFLFLENSPAIVGNGLGTVLGDLAARGHDGRWTVLAAADVGAPHIRERWWGLFWRADAMQGGRGISGITETSSVDSVCQEVANAGEVGRERVEDQQGIRRETAIGGKAQRHPGDSCPLRHTSGLGLEESQPGQAGDEQPPATGADRGLGWWGAEPDIAALGNGQVPLCAAAAWKILGGP